MHRLSQNEMSLNRDCTVLRWLMKLTRVTEIYKINAVFMAIIKLGNLLRLQSRNAL